MWQIGVFYTLQCPLIFHYSEFNGQPFWHLRHGHFQQLNKLVIGPIHSTDANILGTFHSSIIPSPRIKEIVPMKGRSDGGQHNTVLSASLSATPTFQLSSPTIQFGMERAYWGNSIRKLQGTFFSIQIGNNDEKMKGSSSFPLQNLLLEPALARRFCFF